MPPPVLIVARGEHGHAWASVVRRNPQAQLLGVLDLDASGWEGIDAAVGASPDAAVAVWAAGPRESTQIAERLVAHPGPTLLHPAPGRPPPGTGLQLTHAWLSLGGVGALERLFSARGVEGVRLAVKGLPEGRTPGLAPALYHAATLVLRLGQSVRVDRAVLATEQDLLLTLTVDGVPWRVEVGARGHALDLAVRTNQGDYQWGADGVSETLRRPRAEARVIPATPWAERCLAQLSHPLRGGDLADARAARALVDEVEQSLERRLPPNRCPRVSTAQGFTGLGLAGLLPDAAPMAAVPPPVSELPLDAVAYALGLRPAAHLTVWPQDVERVAARLPGAVERRPRVTSVAVGDRLDDERAPAEPRVDLFAAREPDVARRLADYQAADPAGHVTEIGGLLGYPACCVQAFAALSSPTQSSGAERGDSSFVRACIAARTAIGPGPWPRLLDDTSLALLPHVPCTYRCERSVAQATALLEALGDEDPALRDAASRYLGGPVLYFDQDHQVRFDGESSDPMTVRYRGLTVPRAPSEGFAHLAAAIALGDRLVLTELALSVYRGEDRVFDLERTDPGLGFLMPFAPRPA